MESGNLKELYEKYHPNKEIEYYIFYNKFREEFQDSRRNDFSIIIMKYELNQNFIFEYTNLLGHLACFCNSEQIDFFKKYFTKEQLEHMANYVNCLGKTVFHYAIMQIKNIEMLQFLFTLTNNIDNKDIEGETPFQEACHEYSQKYVMNSEWGKLYLQQIEKK